MEYLSRCLESMNCQPGFNYHPKCKRIKLTELMFVDDLLIFVRADHTLVGKMMEAFRKFSKASWLKPNNDKSCIYFSGINYEELLKYLTISKCLLVPYLLSILGYLLLQKNLASLNAQIFPLPKKLIKVVETICRRFLWIGAAESLRKAPVALSFIQLPKTIGGLNVVNMVNWNKAAMLKLLWVIAFKQDKLWVRWINAYYIKRSNILDVAIISNIAWVLRKIVASRDLLIRVGGWSVISSPLTFTIKKTSKLQGDNERVE
ncbi:uncharacterized protein LOC104899130 [Beta vulgaris subsp. vulgaris]|uniref:uncharacterized protein LOC104899130 n=1 Tax=Beta vulgaris subsp. vulgaris TaxID=3555 RepID=UPI0005400A4A|nr:uncharacterized protein LOC104899130 [Beta vulgaris subsp. vulgaris]